MNEALLPEPTENEAEDEVNRQADAMKDRLREDVASWSADHARAPASPMSAPLAPEALTVPPPVAKPVSTRPSRAKAKVVEAVKPPAPKAPFKMSYDGTTERDYIAHIIRLNAR